VDLASRYDPPFWIGDRLFTQADVDLIRDTAERFARLSRSELASTICENLPWKAPNGQPRTSACLPLLDELAAAGVIRLPPKGEPVRRRPTHSPVPPLPALELSVPLASLRPIRVEPVPADERALWNATMAAHHPLGFVRAVGAHQRYWIYGHYAGQEVILGAMLFAAPARNVTVRDAFVGWTALEQTLYRHRIVAQSRFLILPGVHAPNLASHALALATRRLPADWLERFGYAPLLVETFVAPPHSGTCYRAANWLYLGQTKGTGRQDRRYDQQGVVRHVFVYPLVPDVQCALVAPSSPTPAQLPESPPDETQGGGESMTTIEQRLSEISQERIRQRFAAVAPFLNEKQRRLLAGAEAIAYGEGGAAKVAALVDMMPETVRRGMAELNDPATIEPERVRKPGGGRRPKRETDPDLATDLDRLVSPESRGDPMSPLRWTTKSTRHLAAELNAMRPGRKISSHLVGTLLHEAGYSLQANRKTVEGKGHPDRDEQFHHINDRARDFQSRGQPVVSVDCKKKELVGTFKNGGREWQPAGQPERVNVHDFPDEQLGKVAPYGVYDPVRNEGWVNVGTDHDTAAFAVASIRGWWQSMGREAYPDAHELLITADGGGSNGSHCRLWKIELQKLADETGLSIAVSHFPPGTSKWNRIEHHLFSRITQNWRGRPLTSHDVIVNLIANTTTTKGLKVRCQLDRSTYPTGIKVSDAELKRVHIQGEDFHSDWNYLILPSQAGE